MSKAETKLAIDGSTPVRSRPFPPWPFVTEEEKGAVLEVLDSSKINYHRGTKGIEFERAFADYVGTRYAATCNSGTSALHIALASVGCGPGDEVIAPNFTFEASANAALLNNAVPVFADLDPDLPTLSPEGIEAAITPRTKAIIAVHLYGHPCRMDEIMALAAKHGISVIEDCAQSHGAVYRGRVTGSIGHTSAFSFCQTKIMTTGGEGGMVTTDNGELAGRAASIRDFGEPYAPPEGLGRYKAVSGTQCVGFNYRMTEMQSAIGLALTRQLPSYVAKRRTNMAYLKSGLAQCASVRIVDERPGTECAPYALFAMVNPDALRVGRDQFVAALSSELSTGGGMAVRKGAYAPINEADMLAQANGYGGKPCPIECPWYKGSVDYAGYELANAKRFAERCMVFEVHPTIEAQDLDDVIEAVHRVEEAWCT